jgi:GT2 family glycosyltransferase
LVDNSSDKQSIHQLINWAGGYEYYDVKTEHRDLVFPLEDKPINYCVVKDDEFGAGRAAFKQNLIIIQAKNNGFAAANNIVLSYISVNASAGELIWVLNNDTVVEKQTLNNLVNAFNKSDDKRILLAAKLREYSQPIVKQAIVGKYNKWLGKHTHIGRGETDQGQYDSYRPGTMDYIVGASIFLPFSFLEDVGLMCEDYFLYFEELDWMQSGRKHGYKIALVPDAIVYHREGTSIIGEKKNKQNIVTAEYYSIVNRVRFIRKWYPVSLFTVMAGVVFALVKRVFQGKIHLARRSAVTILGILFRVGSTLPDDKL